VHRQETIDKTVPLPDGEQLLKLENYLNTYCTMDGMSTHANTLLG